MTIGQRIALKRKEQGLSQEALGERLGVSRQAIYKWESDGALPEIDKLVSLSRLFGVTVGWLLGVETESQEAAANDGELTETQLNMVQEIVDRYLAAQPQPKKRPKWPVAVAGIVLIFAGFNLFAEFDMLRMQNESLQNDISRVERSVDSQINSITNRVEEILKAQNNLTADYGTEIAHALLDSNTIVFDAYAVPKTYVEGMTAQFCRDDGTGALSYTEPVGALGEKFQAAVTSRLTDSITISVVFAYPDGSRQTQLLDSYDGLYSATFPEISLQSYDHIINEPLTAEGRLVMDETYLSVRPETDSVAAVNTKLGQAEIGSIQMGLFKNKRLVAWAESVDGVPDGFSGNWDNEIFYRLPAMEIEFTGDDELCFAAIITDQYGRVSLQSDIPYILGEDGEVTWPSYCDLSDHSPDSWDF